MQPENHSLPISKSELITTKPPVKADTGMTTSQVHPKPKLIDVVREKFGRHDEQTLRALRQQLKSTKRRIDEEFEEFSQRLLNFVRHAHLIKFASQTNEDISGIISATETDGSLLQRMADYQVQSDCFIEALENCKYELAQTEEKNRFIDYLEVCPTGWTLVQRFYPVLDKYFEIQLPLKEEEALPPKSPPIFNTPSPSFSEEEYRGLEALLEHTGHKLKKVTMIFRASEHSFRSKAFKEICSKMEKTMVVVKSAQKRVFGGYTPCRWLDTKEKEYIADTNRESFLFSLDEHMVFPIRSHQIDYAISTYGSWGPIFGSPYGPDLSISDQCHLNDHSCSSLGSHYEIPISLKEFSNEAFSLLAGSKKFKVAEYEVFEVEFE